MRCCQKIDSSQRTDSQPAFSAKRTLPLWHTHHISWWASWLFSFTGFLRPEKDSLPPPRADFHPLSPDYNVPPYIPFWGFQNADPPAATGHTLRNAAHTRAPVAPNFRPVVQNFAPPRPPPPSPRAREHSVHGETEVACFSAFVEVPTRGNRGAGRSAGLPPRPSKPSAFFTLGFWEEREQSRTFREGARFLKRQRPPQRPLLSHRRVPALRASGSSRAQASRLLRRACRRGPPIFDGLAPTQQFVLFCCSRVLASVSFSHPQFKFITTACLSCCLVAHRSPHAGGADPRRRS